MIKLVFGLAAVALVACIGGVSAFAAGQTSRSGYDAPGSAASSSSAVYMAGHCGSYVDANSDGVCDNRLSGDCGNYVDANGDGICDNCLSGGCGSYVDANGDGICDNCQNSHCGAGSGAGNGDCAQSQHHNCGENGRHHGGSHR